MNLLILHIVFGYCCLYVRRACVDIENGREVICGHGSPQLSISRDFFFVGVTADKEKLRTAADEQN